MKVRVKIAGKIFDVEIDSLHTQPVIARVDGEPIEVWLENAPGVSTPAEKSSLDAQAAVKDKQIEIRAPIPGRIISVAVKAGDTVAYGQELCVLDAMKMKNPIRSPREGEIGEVFITVGQTVKHNELLVAFTQEDVP